METIRQGRREDSQRKSGDAVEDNPAFQAALPLLLQILGMEMGAAE
jgi:hypothetical protein